MTVPRGDEDSAKDDLARGHPLSFFVLFFWITLENDSNFPATFLPYVLPSSIRSVDERIKKDENQRDADDGEKYLGDE